MEKIKIYRRCENCGSRLKQLGWDNHNFICICPKCLKKYTFKYYF